MKNEYKQIITDYVRSHYVFNDETEIPLDRSLVDAGIIDSFGIISLVSFIEKEFEFRIPNSDITRDNLGSIEKMADYIEKRVSEK